jgi:hypothetical protein
VTKASRVDLTGNAPTTFSKLPKIEGWGKIISAKQVHLAAKASDNLYSVMVEHEAEVRIDVGEIIQ